MKRCVIGIWKNATDGYAEGNPLIYSNGWKHVKPYIYDGTTWQPIGHAGCLMIQFVTSNSLDFYTSDAKPFLVKSHY